MAASVDTPAQLPPGLLIRAERSGDIEPVAALTREAFAGQPYSSHTEQFIVDALRRAGALTLSLVAVQAGLVVGHIAFSPVTVSDGSVDWYGLGPLSVAPALQGRGIGRALVEQGLRALREAGAQGCVLLGDPAFYGRFGFASHPDLRLAGVPQEHFQCQAFGPKQATGDVGYHAAFDATG